MHFPCYQEPGAGLGRCSFVGGWQRCSFSFFSCSPPPFFIYYPPSTSPHHYVLFFFFKVHFETVVTSRSPRDGITSTEIKYTICVSAQLSNVETQYKWQPRVVKLLIGWRIIKLVLESWQGVCQTEEKTARVKCPVYWFGFTFIGIF